MVTYLVDILQSSEVLVSKSDKQKKPYTTLRAHKSSATHLGVTIDSKLDHIQSIISKANQVNAFLYRNFCQCPSGVKCNCYKSIARPIVEYSLPNLNLFRDEFYLNKFINFPGTPVFLTCWPHLICFHYNNEEQELNLWWLIGIAHMHGLGEPLHATYYYSVAL